MSNRMVKHSSRYKGPMGDSRPPAEIFAGMEAREKQAEEYKAKLLAAMDDVMENAKLLTWESRAELVRSVAIEWLFINHSDMMPREQEESK